MQTVSFRLCHPTEAQPDLGAELQNRFGLRIKSAKRLHLKAWDFTCEPFVLTDALRQFCYQAQLDFAKQSLPIQPKKLFLSDMDATMVQGETIDEMAAAFHVTDAVASITTKAMRGELDFYEALLARLELLKGFSKDEIAVLLAKLNYHHGAAALLTHLKQAQVHTVLVSGGFTLFSEKVAKDLGFDQHFANILQFENELFTGQLLGDVVHAEKKKQLLIETAERLKITLAETVAIGDGANDIPMLKSAGLGVAFMGKPSAKEAVEAEIHTGHLENLIYLC